MDRNAIDCLREHGVKVSAQRVAVLNYLWEHRTHPTINEIYEELNPQTPSLSKTTLYSTLKLFAEKKVALMLGIDDKNTRFDGDVSPHAHFQCIGCGQVFDIFPNDLPAIKTVYRKKIGEFNIITSELSYKCYCKHCADKMNLNKES